MTDEMQRTLDFVTHKTGITSLDEYVSVTDTYDEMARIFKYWYIYNSTEEGWHEASIVDEQIYLWYNIVE